MEYFTLAAGLVLLLVAGDILVRGAVSLAVRLDIPTMVIGLTIVAFGTSAPELVISLRAALAGSPGIAIGNVVGSNIANIFLVLGVPALIAATNCDQPFIKRNTFYVIGASLLFPMEVPTKYAAVSEAKVMSIAVSIQSTELSSDLRGAPWASSAPK